MSEAAREIIPENAPALEVLPEPAPEAPMRWHSFLVKFYLWLAAALHLFQAYRVLSGGIYFEVSIRDAVYSALPALRILDYTFAISLAAAAGLMLLSRRKLAKRQKAGIVLLSRAYIVLILATTCYALASFFISGLPSASMRLLGRAIAGLALMLANRSYYRKRLDLFDPA